MTPVRAPTYLQNLQFLHFSSCPFSSNWSGLFPFLNHSHCLPVLRPSHMRLFLPGKFFSQIFPWLFSILVGAYVQTHQIAHNKYVQFIAYRLYVNRAVKRLRFKVATPEILYLISVLIFLQFFSNSLPYLFSTYPVHLLRNWIFACLLFYGNHGEITYQLGRFPMGYIFI